MALRVQGSMRALPDAAMLHAGVEWPEPRNTRGRPCAARALHGSSCPRPQPAEPGHRRLQIQRQSLRRIPCRSQKHLPCQEASHRACCPQLCPQVWPFCAALLACVLMYEACVLELAIIQSFMRSYPLISPGPEMQRISIAVHSVLLMPKADAGEVRTRVCVVLLFMPLRRHGGCREAPSTFGRSAHKEELKRQKRAAHAGKSGKRSRQK